MRKKKLVAATISCVLVAVLSFGVSYAFLIDKSYRPNHFTVGETTVTVNEEFTPPDVLQPGTTFTKKPTVQNTGNLPCFVRVRVTFSDDRAESFTDLDLNTTDWEKNAADGCYYYKTLLEPGKSTVPLFTKATVKTQKEDGSPYEESDMIEFEIFVYSEAAEHKSHLEQPHPQAEYKTAWNSYQK